MATRTVGFIIEIKGTNEQQRELTKLTGELIKTTANTAKFRKQAKEAGGENKLFNASLAKSELRQKALRKRIGETTRSIQQQSGQFKKTGGLFTSVNKAVSNSFRQVGLAIGVAFGARAIASTIGGAIKIFKDFQQANADLASILGKTRSEISELTEDAKRLGAVTVFTASEITSLQVAFAKLGFSTEEILNATEATSQLAAATGEDLAQAALVTGKVIRGFGLDASETQRVVDVLAKTLTSTATIGLAEFEVSMAKIAPIAKGLGFTLEETSSLLGVLRDSGLDASIAGTSLRSIFLKLADANGDLAKALGGPVKSLDEFIPALKELQEKGIDVAGALELTDKRAVTAFLTFLDGADKVDVLNKELINAGGTAERMAEEQLNTLTGETKLLNSAWEGFILSLESGDGIIAKLIGGLIKFATQILGLVTSQSKLSDKLRDTNIQLNAEFELLKSGNITQEQRVGLIDKINTSYGDYLPNLLTEKSSLEDIEKAQRGANAALLARIELQAKEEIIAEASQKLGKTQKALFEEQLKDDNFFTRTNIRNLENREKAETDALESLISRLGIRKKVTEEAAEDEIDINKDLGESEKELTDKQKKEFEKREKDAAAARKKEKAELEKETKELNAISEDLLRQSIDNEIELIQDEEAQKLAILTLAFNDELAQLDEQKIALAENKVISEEELRVAQDQFDQLELQAEAKFEKAKQKNRDDAAKKVIEGNERLANSEQALQDAKVAATRAGLQILAGLAGENTALQVVLFAADKALAVASIVVNLQREIAAIAAANALLGPIGIPITAAQTTAANIRAGIGIGTIAAQTIAGFAEGGLIPGTYDGKDDVPALLSMGEVVLNPMQQARLGGAEAFRAAGVPGFQAGGAIGAPPNILPPSIAAANAGSTGAISRQEAVELLTEGLNNIKVGVLESEITTVQKRVAVLEAD